MFRKGDSVKVCWTDREKIGDYYGIGKRYGSALEGKIGTIMFAWIDECTVNFIDKSWVIPTSCLNLAMNKTTVKKCSDCPFLIDDFYSEKSWYCRHPISTSDRNIRTSGKLPKWCPLKNGKVTIELSEEKL